MDPQGKAIPFVVGQDLLRITFPNGDPKKGLFYQCLAFCQIFLMFVREVTAAQDLICRGEDVAAVKQPMFFEEEGFCVQKFAELPLLPLDPHLPSFGYL